MQPTKGANVAHWVLKIGSLKTSMEFFENILGLRVLRHEEFATGCEATCNGPYGGRYFAYPLTNLLTHSLTHSLTYLLTYLSTLTYSLTHLLTYLLTHSLTYALTHLLTTRVSVFIGAWSKTMIGYGPERENFALVGSISLIFLILYLHNCLRN